MATLFRFVLMMAILAGIVIGAMFALTIFVKPTPTEMSERIPSRELFGK